VLGLVVADPVAVPRQEAVLVYTYNENQAQTRSALGAIGKEEEEPPTPVLVRADVVLDVGKGVRMQAVVLAEQGL
jgi:hypothetical protein